jgi:uncharacterized RDD family membrane protein YckC
MARWRDVKKGKITTQDKKQAKQEEIINEDACAPILDRVKAFITDMFMIMMPIMYITTYIIMDGKDDFQGNDMAHWVTMFIYGAITVAFWKLKGQTPGFKAYELKLVSSKTKKIPDLVIVIFRYIMFLVSAITIVGALLPFFRQDKKTLQDVVTGTSVIKTDS